MAMRAIRRRAGQVADTRTVYEHPANVFVAGFIGSPSMSFATPGTSRHGSTWTLRAGELSLTIETAQLALPREVIVGIRPEHTRAWSEDMGLVGPIAGRATFVEMLGRETLIGVDAAGERFTVLADADTRVVPGDRITFGVEPGRMFFFDPTTTEAIAIV